MPRIVTRNIDIEVVKKASNIIIDHVAEVFKIDRTHVTIEVNQNPFVFDGKVQQSHPFVELGLFPRPKEKVDLVVKLITEEFLKYGCDSVDVYVFNYEAPFYYENGEHF